ncbi:uncharacterized protein [Amphiura filiformis]|uniref:uncharacterized protein n=1 Tax=Amphiura filiformis TaxID=82378 RepID=UPI003B20F12A
MVKKMSTPGRIEPDLMVSTIRELQQEKARQEKTLTDLRRTRTQLERKSEAGIRELHLVKEKNEKLMETLKIAEHKLELSQKELDRQQIRNKDLECKIDALSKEIEEEKDRQQREVEDFQTKLAQLADQFIQAKTYYMDNNLAKEMSSIKKTKNSMENEAIAGGNEADKLADQLQQLNLQKEALIQEADLNGISLELQHQILETFLTEKSNAEVFNNKVVLEEKQIQEQVQKLREVNEELATKLLQIKEQNSNRQE